MDKTCERGQLWLADWHDTIRSTKPTPEKVLQHTCIGVAGGRLDEGDGEPQKVLYCSQQMGLYCALHTPISRHPLTWLSAVNSSCRCRLSRIACICSTAALLSAGELCAVPGNRHWLCQASVLFASWAVAAWHRWCSIRCWKASTHSCWRNLQRDTLRTGAAGCC